MSMENTLQPGEYVLVDKLTPRIDDYSRGDVVVFSPPAGYDQGGNTPFIKRVIGLPGDTDRGPRRTGHGQRQGARRGRTRSRAPPRTSRPTRRPTETEWTIASDELFVLGDHRAASSDSRVFGPIKRDSVIGRAWLRYWPIGVFGILRRRPIRSSKPRRRERPARHRRGRDGRRGAGGDQRPRCPDRPDRARRDDVRGAVPGRSAARPGGPGRRVVAAVLGGYLLFVVLRGHHRGHPRARSSDCRPRRWPRPRRSSSATARAGSGSAPLGPAAPAPAGFALAVIAVAPIVRGADVFRLGVALAVLVTGAELVRVGLAGTPPPLEQLDDRGADRSGSSARPQCCA